MAIEPVSDALSIIRKRPDMYVLGYPARLGEVLTSHLVFDAIVAEASPVVVDRVRDWWLVGSPVDWLAGAGRSVEHLFSQLVATPHVGDNTNRHEVLVAALTKGVAVFRDGALEWRSGDGEAHPELEKYVAKQMPRWRVVSFLP